MPRTLDHETGALLLLDVVYRNQLLVQAQFSRQERLSLLRLGRAARRIANSLGLQDELDRERVIHSILCCAEISAVAPNDLDPFACKDVNQEELREFILVGGNQMLESLAFITGETVHGVTANKLQQALQAGLGFGAIWRDAPRHMRFRLVERVLAAEQPHSALKLYAWLSRMNVLVPEKYSKEVKHQPCYGEERLALRAMLLLEFESLRKHVLKECGSVELIRATFESMSRKTKATTQDTFYQIGRNLDERLTHPNFRSATLCVDHRCWTREDSPIDPRRLKSLFTSLGKLAPGYPLFIQSKTGLLGMLGGAHVRHALRRAKAVGEKERLSASKKQKRLGTFSHEIPSLCSSAAEKMAKLNFIVNTRTINKHSKTQAPEHEQLVADYLRQIQKMPATPPTMLEDYPLLRVIREVLESSDVRLLAGV